MATLFGVKGDLVNLDAFQKIVLKTQGAGVTIVAVGAASDEPLTLIEHSDIVNVSLQASQQGTKVSVEMAATRCLLHLQKAVNRRNNAALNDTAIVALAIAKTI